MGTRVGAVGAFTPGRSHFPMLQRPYQYARYAADVPTRNEVTEDGSDAAIGPGTNYPFKLDLKQMLRWFYVVKTWHIRLDVGYGYGATPHPLPGPDHVDYSIYYGTAVVEFDLTWKINQTLISGELNLTTPTREVMQVLSRSTQAFRVNIGFDNSFNTLEPGSATIIENQTVSLSNVADYDSADNFYDYLFQFDFSLTVGPAFWEKSGTKNYFYPQGYVFFSPYTLADSWWLINPDHIPSVDVGTFYIDDKSGDIQSTSIKGDGTDFSANDSTRVFSSTDATFTAKKFWPFANTQGSPVYGETSGAQLVDPFS